MFDAESGSLFTLCLQMRGFLTNISCYFYFTTNSKNWLLKYPIACSRF